MKPKAIKARGKTRKGKAGGECVAIDLPTE